MKIEITYPSLQGGAGDVREVLTRRQTEYTLRFADAQGDVDEDGRPWDLPWLAGAVAFWDAHCARISMGSVDVAGHCAQLVESGAFSLRFGWERGGVYLCYTLLPG